MRWSEIVESRSDWMTGEQMLRSLPDMTDNRDLAKSILWASGAKLLDCSFQISQESFELFRAQAEECMEGYDEFPKDRSRVHRIVTEIKGGANKYPLFVEYGDPTKFVIEGRHRMVAFLKLNVSHVTVVWVKAP